MEAPEDGKNRGNIGRNTGKINEDKGRTEKVKSCCWQTTAILSWRHKKMVLKNTIMFLIALLVMFGVAQSLAQPTDSPDCGSVALDLSSSRGNLKGSVPKLSALYRRTLRGEASLAVNKGYCPDCRSGSIDASSLIPTPP